MVLQGKAIGVFCYYCILLSEELLPRLIRVYNPVIKDLPGYGQLLGYRRKVVLREP